ncbi:hypothetical protein IV102_05090 [bacterium]|nr:hypothetical protein [bacterium]
MISLQAEILPSLGLGGLLLGQSLRALPWEEQWQETGTIVRGTLAGGAIEVVGDSALDRIIGLLAQPGYEGHLPQGIGLGTPFGEALRRLPRLRSHDLDSSLYEPDQLGFVLFGETQVESIQICDWGHDYWTFARPLLCEDECQED